MYYIIDLERTISSGLPFYWKKSRYGYTYSIEEAGLFPKEIADEIVKKDIQDLTVKIHINTMAELIRNLEIKSYEVLRSEI